MPKGGKTSKLKKFGIYLLYGIGILALVWLTARLMPGSPSLLPMESLNSGSGSALLTKSSFRGSVGVNAPNAVPPPAPKAAPGSSEADYSADSSSAAATPATERKVVKSDALTLLVSKAEATAEQIKSIAAGFGGFTDEMDIYEISDVSKSGTITIRVPADKFDEAAQKIKALAIKVEREAIGTLDITEGYADLEARLKNLRAEEAQYQQILKQAKNTDDVLKVTENLGGVRGDIESLQAQIKYLAGQVAMSSIAVSLEEEADVQVWGIRWRPLFTVKQAFRNMLTGLSGYLDSIIGFIFILPALTLWAVTVIAALWVLRKIYRFIKSKFFSN